MPNNFDDLLATFGKGAAKTAVREVSKDSTTTQEDALSSLLSQSSNLKTRMEGAGVDPTKFTDTRNPLEKAFNVRPNQNFIFDIFEVLNRPQQALFGALTETFEGGDFTEGLKKGFTGENKDYTGGGMLRALTTGSSEETGAFDLSDVAGFALDVFADPADIPFLGAGGVAKALGKTSEIVSKLDDVIDSSVKVMKTSKDTVFANKAFKETMDNINKLWKGGDIPKDVAEASMTKVKQAAETLTESGVDELGDVVDAAEKALPPAQKAQYLQKLGHNYKMLQGSKETFVSPSDLLMRGLFGTAKAGFEVGDDAITLIASKMGQGTLNGYEGVKRVLTSTFDHARALPKGTSNALRRAVGTTKVFKDFAAMKFKIMDDIIEKAAESTGQDADHVATMFHRYFSLTEDDLGRTARSVQEILTGDVPWTYSEKAFNTLAKNLSIQPEDLAKKLQVFEFEGRQWISVADIDKSMLKRGAGLDEPLIPERLYTKGDIDEMTEFFQSMEGQPFYDEFKANYHDLMDRGIPLLDLNYKQGKGYMRNVLTEDAKYDMMIKEDISKVFEKEDAQRLLGNTKITSRRSYPAMGKEANYWSEAAVADRYRKMMVENGRGIFKFKSGNPLSLDAIKTVDPTKAYLKKEVLSAMSPILSNHFDEYLDMTEKQLREQGPNVGIDVPQRVQPGTESVVYKKGGKVYMDVMDTITDDKVYDEFVRAKKETPKELLDYLTKRYDGDAQAAQRAFNDIADDYRLPQEMPVVEPEIEPTVEPTVEAPKPIEVAPAPKPEPIAPKRIRPTIKKDVAPTVAPAPTLRAATPEPILKMVDEGTLSDYDAYKLVDKVTPGVNGIKLKDTDLPPEIVKRVNDLRVKNADLGNEVFTREGFRNKNVTPGGKALPISLPSMLMTPAEQEQWKKIIPNGGTARDVQAFYDKIGLVRANKEARMKIYDESEAIGKRLKEMLQGEQAVQEVVEEVAPKVDEVTQAIAEAPKKTFKQVGKDVIDTLDDDDIEELDNLYRDFYINTTDKVVSESWSPNLLKPNKDGYYKLTPSVQTKISDAIESGEVNFTEETYTALKKLDDTYGTDFTAGEAFDGFREEVIDRTPAGMVAVSPQQARRSLVETLGAKQAESVLQKNDADLGAFYTAAKAMSSKGKYVDILRLPDLSEEISDLIAKAQLISEDMQRGAKTMTRDAYIKTLDDLYTQIGAKARAILTSNEDTMYVNKVAQAVDEVAPKVTEEIVPKPIEVPPKPVEAPKVKHKAKVKPKPSAMIEVQKALDDVAKEVTKGEDILSDYALLSFKTKGMQDKLLKVLAANKVSDDIIAQINTPQGWDVLDAYAQNFQKASIERQAEKQAQMIAMMEHINSTPKFHEDVRKSITNWFDAFSKEAKDANTYRAYFAHEAFSNIGTEGSLVNYKPLEMEDYVRPDGEVERRIKMTDGKIDAKAPSGYTRISAETRSELVRKMNHFNKYVDDVYLKEYAEAIEKFDLEEGILSLENNMLRTLNLDWEKGPGDLLKIVDFSNNLFKRFKLLTVGFNIRNTIGIYTNMWLSGVPVKEIPELFAKTHELFSEYPDILKRFAADMDNFQMNNPEDYRKLLVVQDFIANGFTPPKSLQAAMKEGLTGAGTELQEIQNMMSGIASKGKSMNIIDKATLANGWANEYMDAMGRMSVYLKALDGEAGEAYMQMLGVNSPAEAVRLAMFDPKNISDVENKVLRRVIPFYTFTKMNLVYHMENMPANARRYYRLAKAVNASWDALGLKEEDVDDYKLGNMYLPLPGGKNGKYYAIKANLPQTDFAEWLGNPLQRLTASAAPLIRAPFELAMGTQAFTGQPIERYKGERSTTLPFLDKKQEYLLGQTGLDAPLKSIASIGKLGSFDLPGFASGFTNMGVAGDVNKTRISKAYDELNALQDGVKLLKAQGIELPTLSDLENKDKSLENASLTLDQLLKLK